MSEVSTISSGLRDVEESLKAQPLKALAAAAVTGFVVWRWLQKSTRCVFLGLVGRTVLHDVASSALS
jgi:hypothetical protein